MTKIDKAKLKVNITNLSKSMNYLSIEIKKLSNCLNEMMKGNSDGPYWNGKQAKSFYNKAVANLRHDIADYTAAYDKLNDIALKYENLTKTDNS